MNTSYFQDAGIRAGINVGNLLYERVWDKCLKAKTSDEKIKFVETLNKLWPARLDYFQMKYHAQLNKPEETA